MLFENSSGVPSWAPYRTPVKQTTDPPNKSKGPQPVSKARYGLERVEAGVYLHPGSGRYILQTHEWEGPRGGSNSRWETADWEGGFVVGRDGDLWTTLRECARFLDEQTARQETGEGDVP